MLGFMTRRAAFRGSYLADLSIGSFVASVLMAVVLLFSPLLSSVAVAGTPHADMQNMNMQNSVNTVMPTDEHMSGMSFFDCLYGDDCPEGMQSMCADHCASVGGGLITLLGSASVASLEYYVSNHQIALSEQHLLNVFLEHSTPPPKQA